MNKKFKFLIFDASIVKIYKCPKFAKSEASMKNYDIDSLLQLTVVTCIDFMCKIFKNTGFTPKTYLTQRGDRPDEMKKLVLMSFYTPPLTQRLLCYCKITRWQVSNVNSKVKTWILGISFCANLRSAIIRPKIEILRKFFFRVPQNQPLNPLNRCIYQKAPKKTPYKGCCTRQISFRAELRASALIFLRNSLRGTTFM